MRTNKQHRRTYADDDKSSERILARRPARGCWQQDQQEVAGNKPSERSLARRPANGNGCWQEDQREDAGNKTSKRSLATSPARGHWQEDQREDTGNKTSERTLGTSPANGRWQEDQREDAGIKTRPVNSRWQSTSPAYDRWQQAQQMNAGGGQGKPGEQMLAVYKGSPANSAGGRQEKSSKRMLAVGMESPANRCWRLYHISREEREHGGLDYERANDCCVSYHFSIYKKLQGTGFSSLLVQILVVQGSIFLGSTDDPTNKPSEETLRTTSFPDLEG